jgi:hypothetical protein
MCKTKTHKYKHIVNAGKQQITAGNKQHAYCENVTVRFSNKWELLNNLNERLTLFLKKYLAPGT